MPNYDNQRMSFTVQHLVSKEVRGQIKFGHPMIMVGGEDCKSLHMCSSVKHSPCNVTISLADLRGVRDVPPPRPKFHFHAVLGGKNGQGNPGSATTYG